VYKNTAGQKVNVYAYDRNTLLPVDGDAANIAAWISKDGAAGVASSYANPVAVANLAGVYAFELTQAETNCDLFALAAASTTADVAISPVIERTLCLPTAAPGTADGLPTVESLARRLVSLNDAALRVGKSKHAWNRTGAEGDIQAYCKTLFGVSGAVRFVSLAGDEGNTGLTPAQAKLSPKAAVESAAAGDLLLIKEGVFALGANWINQPHGVHVQGEGRFSTSLQSTFGATRCLWTPGSDATLSDLEVAGTLVDGSFQLPLGCRQSYKPFQNFLGRGLRIRAATDALYFTQCTAECSLRLVDCLLESNWDAMAFVSLSYPVTVELSDCLIYARGPVPFIPGENARCVGGMDDDAAVRLNNCWLIAENADLATYGIYATVGRVEMQGGGIRVSGAPNNYYAYNNAPGVVILSDVDFNGTVLGTGVTEVSRKVGPLQPPDKTQLKLAADGLAGIASPEPTAKPTAFVEKLLWLVQSAWRAEKSPTQLKILTEAGATVTTQPITDDHAGSETRGAPV